MIEFVNAKINIGLSVVKRREDGYHELSTVFYPVGRFAGTPENPESFCDMLEISGLSEESQCSEKFLFETSGESVDCPNEKNLVYKAAKLYFDTFTSDFDFKARILLEKHLPSQAGMGGGSADAAFTLKMLRDLQYAQKIEKCGIPVDSFTKKCYETKLPTDKELCELAVRLGADCPFFLLNRPAYASGIGDQLEPIDLDLSGKWLVVVKPPVSISTAAAFAGITPKIPEFDLREITSLKIEDWKHIIINDFEKPFFDAYPGMRFIKDKLYDSGAQYASLTGSGSCIYGIFENQTSAASAKKSFTSGPTISASYLLKL